MSIRTSFSVISLVFGSLIVPPHNVMAEEQSSQSWYNQGKEFVDKAKQIQLNTADAKRIILFVGDGMGISTQVAARILQGQQKGRSGEENLLAFEQLPYSALVKTYNTNQQVADSAGTMTAIMTGVKTKAGFISVGPEVARGDCKNSLKFALPTFLEQAEKFGWSTGIISTARITHATPAATYAHVPERDWEDDSELPSEAKIDGCTDIAKQLIDFSYGDGIDIILGGGRRHFLPKSVFDPEYPEKTGQREDNLNLIQLWQQRNPKGQFVFNAQQFATIDTSKTNRILGLFERSHLQFEVDRAKDAGGEPSLSELTAKAIEFLEKKNQGYFLVVESGRIDHAHHGSNAYRALNDTIAFSDAIATAKRLTDSKDTLILVTADHSHVFTMAGYPMRGNPILGKVTSTDNQGNPAKSYALDAYGLPYTSLSYANGPGYRDPKQHAEGKGRPDLTQIDTQAHDYLQESTVPLGSETHGGEDVAIFADGPQAHLVRGVIEQHVIYHIMRAAAPW